MRITTESKYVQNQELIKILLLNVDPKRNLAVPMYLELLMKHLDVNKYGTRYFIQSKSTSLRDRILFPLIIITRLIRFLHALIEYKPDVVHLNPSLRIRAMIRDSVYLCFARMFGFKVLFFIHGWDKKVSRCFDSKGLLSKVFYWIFSAPRRIVVLSNEFKDELISLGISASKIVVLPTMVDSKQFYPGKKEFAPPFKILFCGSMIKEKGLYELLKSIPLVLEKYHDTSFIFMGVGAERSNLRNLSKRMRLGNNVKFIGFKKGSEKNRIFKNCHIVILPSYSEGFPLVVLEGMASGSSIVATSVGGLRNALYDGVSGLTIESNPPIPRDIADKIISLIENPQLMEKISKYNLMVVRRKYDVHIVCKYIEEIYDSIVKNSEFSVSREVG